MYISIYIHICTSLTGTSLESQVMLFDPLTMFLVFGTLNLHKGVVAIGAAYPSSSHFKHMKLQMFPFQFHQKKNTNMKPRSENMDVQLASLQCSGSINPRAATKLRELSRGGSFNPRDIQECKKKGGRAGRVLSEAAHLFAIPLFKKNGWNPYCTGAINIIVCVLFIDHGLLG